MSCYNYDVFNFNKMNQPGDFRLDSLETVYSPLHLQSLAQFLVVAMNILNHIIILIITLAMAYRCWILEFKKTALHAHLCTLGFVCLMAEGMMVRYQGNVLFYNYLPPSKTLVHSLLQFVGGSLGIGGTLQKYWGKEKHFRSTHAKLGLVACILCAINFVSGFCGLLLPQARWGMRLLHGFLGLATFIAGMLAQVYGYETGFFRRNFSESSKHLYKFFTIVVLALSTIGPFKILVYKIYIIMYGLDQEETLILNN